MGCFSKVLGPTPQVRKRYFLSHLYIKMIFLPRQAQDKHRENSKKSTVFLQGAWVGVLLAVGAVPRIIGPWWSLFALGK